MGCNPNHHFQTFWPFWLVVNIFPSLSSKIFFWSKLFLQLSVQICQFLRLTAKVFGHRLNPLRSSYIKIRTIQTNLRKLAQFPYATPILIYFPCPGCAYTWAFGEQGHNLTKYSRCPLYGLWSSMKRNVNEVIPINSGDGPCFYILKLKENKIKKTFPENQKTWMHR